MSRENWYQVDNGKVISVDKVGERLVWIGDSLTAFAGKNSFEKIFSGAYYGESFGQCLLKMLIKESADYQLF